MDTRNARRRKHSGEAFLRGGRIERRSIQQQTVARRSQQQTSLIVRSNGSAQFAPCGFILFRRAGMTEVVHPGKLQKNVQATDERAGCSSSSGIVTVRCV
jgi:hypothetical protein